MQRNLLNYLRYMDMLKKLLFRVSYLLRFIDFMVVIKLIDVNGTGTDLVLQNVEKKVMHS